jgi:sn-glycerol 3-phosphate transport system substrate-binding protein
MTELGVRRSHIRRTGLVVSVAAALSMVCTIPALGSARSAWGATSPKCPVGAAKKASDKPVQITLWHAVTAENETTLQKLTDQFNASQKNVKVKLVNQVSYESLFEKYKAGLGGGDLPDLALLGDTSLQSAIDSQSVLPVQACVNADKYPLDDFIRRTIAYYSVGGQLIAMPFSVSNPVLYYNKQAFEKAGLDPEKPPTTLDEIKSVSKKLVDAGVTTKGFAFKSEPWILEHWLAKAGKTYVNNGNGRRSRATKTTFDNSVGVGVFSWLNDMVDSGLAVNTGSNNFDNMFALGNGNAAMTIDTSANLGTVIKVLQAGQFPNVTVGVAPMPGPVGKGGVLVGGGALYIVKGTSKAKQDAAWQYIKYLVAPEQQAEWGARTGYVPIRTSATGLPAIQELWATHPEFKVAYDQLVTGVNNAATAGPVIGPYQEVRDGVVDQLNAMFTQGKSPKAAVKSAAENGTSQIEEYNSRVGA